MASRWMQPKLDKMKRERLARAKEYRDQRQVVTVEKLVARRVTGEMVQSFKGEVTRGPTGDAPLPVGKGRRMFVKSTGGDFKRREQVTRGMFMQVALASFDPTPKLIPAAR